MAKVTESSLQSARDHRIDAANKFGKAEAHKHRIYVSGRWQGENFKAAQRQFKEVNKDPRYASLGMVEKDTGRNISASESKIRRLNYGDPRIKAVINGVEDSQGDA